MAVRQNRTLLELTRFAIVGGLNTLVGFTVILGAKFFLDFADVAANALGYAVGLLVSLLLNSRWTFGYTGPVLGIVVPFLLAFALSYLANVAVLLSFIKLLQVNSYLSQAAGVLSYTVCFYLLSKFGVFQSHDPDVRTGR